MNNLLYKSLVLCDNLYIVFNNEGKVSFIYINKDNYFFYRVDTEFYFNLFSNESFNISNKGDYIKFLKSKLKLSSCKIGFFKNNNNSFLGIRYKKDEKKAFKLNSVTTTFPNTDKTEFKYTNIIEDLLDYKEPESCFNIKYVELEGYKVNYQVIKFVQKAMSKFDTNSVIFQADKNLGRFVLDDFCSIYFLPIRNRIEYQNSFLNKDSNGIYE